jgi:predicted lipoprotein with Yx(FWY)xxD motif
MRRLFFSAVLFAAGSALAACGGGSGSTAPGAPPVVQPSTAPSAAPSVAPSATPSAAPSSSPGTQTPGDTKQAQIDGGTALVDAKSGLALYTFDGDTVPDQSTCTGGCLAIWPAHAASSGETATGNFTIFTRSDNGTLQWAYKGKPLYTFTGDTASNNGTGNGLQGFSIARP